MKCCIMDYKTKCFVGKFEQFEGFVPTVVPARAYRFANMQEARKARKEYAKEWEINPKDLIIYNHKIVDKMW